MFTLLRTNCSLTTRYLILIRMPSRSCPGLSFCRFAFKLHLVCFFVHIGVHFISRLNFSIEKLQGQRVLNQALDRPLHGTSTEGRVVAFAEQKCFRCRRKMQSDLPFPQALQQMLHLQIDDVLNLVLAQWPE